MKFKLLLKNTLKNTSMRLMFAVDTRGGVVAVWDISTRMGGERPSQERVSSEAETKPWCIDWNWSQGPAELRYWVNSREDTKLEKPREEREVWEQITKSSTLESSEKAWREVRKGAGASDRLVRMKLPWCSGERRAGEETSFERKSQISLLRDALTGLKNTDLCIKQTVLLMS